MKRIFRIIPCVASAALLAVVLRTGGVGNEPLAQEEVALARASGRARVMTDQNEVRMLPSGPVTNVPAPHAGNLAEQAVPAAAVEARAIASPSLREEMTRRVVQEWAGRDAAAAIAWAAGFPDAGEARIAMQQACASVAEYDPATAIRLAVEHGLDGGPGDFISGLTAAWAGQDVVAAREWVESQPEGEMRDCLLGQVVFELAKAHPAEAASLVAERMEGGGAQVEAAICVVSLWASRDPRAAAAWVETFPDGELRERARRELASADKR